MLREWQTEALGFFKRNKNCIIQAATGTGKTRLAIEVLKYVYSLHPGMKTLIVVPKNVILEKTWFSALCAEFGVNNVGIHYGAIKESSLMTLTNMQSIDGLNMSDYGFTIWDEMHNYMSTRMLELVKSKTEYRLGLTATLGRKDYQHWKLLEIFGFNMYKYDIKDAVKDKVLSNFKFYNVPVDLSEKERAEYDEINDKIRRMSVSVSEFGFEDVKTLKYGILDQRKKILSNSVKKLEALDKLAPRLKGKKIILFNEYNSIATPCFWKLTDLGFNPCIFNSGIGPKTRAKNLEGFAKDKHDVIITTRALDEGYDLPHIDAAVILSGGNTTRQMVQRVGRVLRKTNNDKDVYQVYFRDTIEEEAAMKRYDLMKDSVLGYEVLE